jgi:hypothetical protein
MKKRITLAALGALALLLGVHSAAHHSFAAEYDAAKAAG